MRQLDATGLKRLHRAWRARTTGRVALVLDGLGTPANVGSITRSAAAWRVDHLWLAGPTPPPWAGGAAKVAMGTERYLTCTAVATGVEAVAAAKTAGYQVVGLELADGAVALHEAALGPDVCLVVGHEDHGISRGALEACDAVAYLPLLGKVGSLNVAVAAAVAVYELRRREWV
ncbi:MAG: TrmH family RNA methyltransferase [Acidimicrobiales bacterium]